MRVTSSTTTAERAIAAGLIALVAIMPFHAFLSVWLGDLFGAQALWQSWKEVLLIALTACAGWLLYSQPATRKLLKQPFNVAVIVFTAIGLIVTAFAQPEPLPALFGIKINYEFLIAALLGMLVASANLVRRLSMLTLATSALVSVIAVLQVHVLPRNFMERFGYGPDTVLPFMMIDPVLDTIRVPSTLGGPNQLGSFLILPLALVLALALRRPRWWHPALIMLLSAGIWHSHSRAAWLGSAVAVAVVVALRVRRSWRLPLILGAVASGALVLQLIIMNAGSLGNLQYYIFHGSVADTGNPSSSQQHDAAIRAGLDRIEQAPLGTGLGTAGPASYQASDGGFIPESYHLQIAIEAGIAGLLAFIAVQLAAASLLIKRLPSPAAAAALAALAGISVVNLFLHGWADSSTALVYWTFAGAIMGLAMKSANRRPA